MLRLLESLATFLFAKLTYVWFSFYVIEPLLDDNVTTKVFNLGTIENASMGRMITLTLLSVADTNN